VKLYRTCTCNYPLVVGFVTSFIDYVELKSFRKMKRLLQLVLIIGLTTPLAIFAQDEEPKFEPTFNWSGFTHMWATYEQKGEADAQYGVNVRYLRFKAFGKLAPKVSYAAQFGLDKGNASLVDVYLKYEPSEYLGIQAGRFGVPGIKSGVMTSSIWSSTKLIFNDRATITQKWHKSNSNMVGYRRQGVMLYGSLMDKFIRYYVMGATTSDSYFETSVGSSKSIDKNGLTMYSRIEVAPVENVELGVNFNTGTATVIEDDSELKSMTYSAYALTRQKTYYAFVEYIAGAGETVDADNEVQYNGLIAEGAYKFGGKYEPAVRFDFYVPNSDADIQYQNLTLGFNYYPSKNIALMANYVVRMEDETMETDNDMFYIQLRYKFASKK